MSLGNSFNSLAFTGTVMADAVSFTVVARQGSPVQATTISGTGLAAMQGDTITGDFSGDFNCVPRSFVPNVTTCHANDHKFRLARVR
jgi:hypothetical protein